MKKTKITGTHETTITTNESCSPITLVKFSVASLLPVVVVVVIFLIIVSVGITNQERSSPTVILVPTTNYELYLSSWYQPYVTTLTCIKIKTRKINSFAKRK